MKSSRQLFWVPGSQTRQRLPLGSYLVPDGHPNDPAVMSVETTPWDRKALAEGCCAGVTLLAGRTVVGFGCDEFRQDVVMKKPSTPTTHTYRPGGREAQYRTSLNQTVQSGFFRIVM